MSGSLHETNGHNGLNSKASLQQRNSSTIDGYMVQAEEWERDAVLDPAWERQQKKVTINNSFDSFAKPFCFSLDFYRLV